MITMTQIRMLMAAVLMSGRQELKVGEAVHYASQIMDSVSARERKDNPAWVNVAEDTLEKSNSEVPEVETTQDSEE